MYNESALLKDGFFLSYSYLLRLFESGFEYYDDYNRGDKSKMFLLLGAY